VREDLPVEPEERPRIEAGAQCRVMCAIVGSLGCATVSALCSVSSVITIGNVSIPCWFAVLNACGALTPGYIAGCSENCQP
jgi:hypothetical protein